jgi:hypothetical protein
MSPVAVIAGLVVALLAIVYVWTGMPLAWGIVMVLVVALVALAWLFVASLPRWPG